MSSQEFIQSGQLELYVLGHLDKAEMLEVERMALQFPEVKVELEKIELSFEKLAIENAVTPNNELKNKIWDEIQKADSLHFTEAESETKQSTLPSSSIFKWLSVLAISSALILAYQNSLIKSKAQDLQKNTIILQDSIVALNKALTACQIDKKILFDKSYQIIELKGVKPNILAQARIYFNPQKTDVRIAIQDFPPLPPNKQYQLWALKNGQAIDAGMINIPGQDLQNMKNIASADAFAITIEKLGGVTSPTMSSLFVMGAL